MLFMLNAAAPSQVPKKVNLEFVRYIVYCVCIVVECGDVIGDVMRRSNPPCRSGRLASAASVTRLHELVTRFAGRILSCRGFEGL